MLGLGLAVTVGKRILGGVIDALFSLLNGRATYYENASASKNIVKDIDDADVLDKATILLTPTATSDARVHSVKTYTGDELVTNGGFDTDSDWSKGTGWSVSGGSANYDDTTNGQLSQAISLNVGNYKLSFNISNSSNSGARIWIGNNIGNVSYTDGTYEYYTNGNYSLYITVPSNQTTLAFWGNTGGSSFSIDNVSLTDASSDFIFDRASSATRINSSGLVQDMQSITDPELVLNGDFEELGDETTPASDFSTSDFETNPSSGSVSESNGTLTFNNSTSSGTQVQLKNRSISDSNTYKITFTLSDFTSGSFRISVGNNLTDTINYNDVDAEGTHTFYVTKTGGSARNYFYTGGTSVVVSNISVKEVDPNDRWSFSNVGGTHGWRIADGRAICDTNAATANRNFASSLSLDGSKDYKLTLDILQSADNITVYVGGTSLSTTLPTGENLGYEYYISSADHSGGALMFYAGSSDLQEIDNVSIKDITFSTDVDLARINYDSNGDNGHILLEPTSTNLVTYSEDFTQSFWNANTDILTPVKSTTIAAPDGSYNAWHITKDGTNSKVASAVGANSTEYTKSIWARTISGTGTAYFGEGQISGDGVLTTVTTEWQRIEITVTQENFYAVDFRGSSTLTEVLIWGAQMEQLSHPTSYIPSLTGSTVTRATETLTGSGNSTLINSTEGVLFGEIAVIEGQSDINRYISINDGTDDNTVSVHFRNNTNHQIRAIVRVGNSSQCDITYNPSGSTSFAKFALKWKANDFALWVNGVEIGSDTSGSTFSANTLNNISFDSGQGGDDFYGKCKALAVFNEALSDTELENLTS